MGMVTATTTAAQPSLFVFPSDLFIEGLQPVNRTGSPHVSIIHQTLTWTTGSLTCVHDHSYACSYKRGLGTPTGQHSIFDSEKLSQLFLVLLVRTSGLWISSPTLYQFSHPTCACIKKNSLSTFVCYQVYLFCFIVTNISLFIVFMLLGFVKVGDTPCFFLLWQTSTSSWPQGDKSKGGGGGGFLYLSYGLGGGKKWSLSETPYKFSALSQNFLYEPK